MVLHPSLSGCGGQGGQEAARQKGSTGLGGRPFQGSPAAKALSRQAYQSLKNKKPKHKTHARDSKTTALTMLAFDD